MEYRKVAILGAGAVGSYLIWGLSKKKGIDFFVVAEGHRGEALKKDGRIINGIRYLPEVKTPDEAHGADLLIVTVKYTALEAALEDISKICDEHTVVMSLMNGVDSEEIIGGKIGLQHMLYSLIKVASERKGTEVKFDPETTIGMIYGEKNNERSGERLDALDHLFESTGLHYRRSDCILSEIWGKFLLNVGNNLPQAIIGCGVGAYSDSDHMAYLRQKLREEVIAIASSKEIDMTKIDTHSKAGSMVKPRARYSTLQDLDAGRRTEIDMFSGAVVRMGKELGIPTPYNDAAFHIIKAMEEKNDGRFDYDENDRETTCSR